MHGKFVLLKDRMVFTERARGLISVADVSDLTAPKMVAHASTPASPGRPVIFGGKIYIPLTYGGIAELILQKT